MCTGVVAGDAGLADKDLEALRAALKVQGGETLVGEFGIMAGPEVSGEPFDVLKVVATAAWDFAGEWT